MEEVKKKCFNLAEFDLKQFRYFIVCESCGIGFLFFIYGMGHGNIGNE